MTDVQFGVPVSRRDDAQRAVRAALELHDTVDAIAAGLAARLGRQLSMHTGIHTGLVIARRSDSRSGDYTLTGDTVNTAARLRGLALPGEVVVSPQTWQQVSDYFEASAGIAVEVKGKERPLLAQTSSGPLLVILTTRFAGDPSVGEWRTALANGEKILVGSALSHNHFVFYDFAIQATLAGAQWDDALRYCDALEAFVAAEPFPWADFIVSRGRLLVRHGRGECSAALRAELVAMRERAAAHEMNFYLRDLDTALQSLPE